MLYVLERRNAYTVHGRITRRRNDIRSRKINTYSMEDLAMKNFKLWMGCLGNGITVCNSAVEESGDYKHIAHISDSGKIKLYVSKSYIPVEDMQKIEQTATEQRKTFLNEWNKQSDIEKYEKLLDMCSLSDFMEIAHNKGITLAEKVKRLETKYI